MDRLQKENEEFLLEFVKKYSGLQVATGRITVSPIDFLKWAIHNNLKKGLQHCVKQGSLKVSTTANLMACYQNLPLDMFEYFWDNVKDEDKNKFVKVAEQNNNKKFVNAVLQYNLWQQKRHEMCLYTDQECFDLDFIYKNA